VDIRVVDTETVSCNLGSMVLVADDMAKTGKSADEIVAKLRDMIPRGRIYFLVDSLEYLAKGGRIGRAKKLLAELLEIKPILQVRDGQVEADPTGEAQALVEELKSKVHVSYIPIYELSPAIVVHVGPRAIGVGFFVE
jgi:fatty acid-binding protein DegV